VSSDIASKRELLVYKVKDRVIFSNSASEHPGVRVNGGVTPFVFNAGSKCR